LLCRGVADAVGDAHPPPTSRVVRRLLPRPCHFCRLALASQAGSAATLPPCPPWRFLTGSSILLSTCG
jgi:hypothetical protein